MTSLSRPLPALPLEILEQIVDLHGEIEDEDWREDFKAQTPRRNHSKTLLACHMVSKQFRVCALRVICHKIFINLYDAPDRLRRLQDVLLADTHSSSQLGSPVRFIKEIVIFLTDHKVDLPEEYTVAQDVDPVLKSIAEKVPMEKLSIFGNTMDTKIYWPKTTSDTLQALEAIIHLPSVVDLYIRGVGKFPNHLTSANTQLRTLTISHIDYDEGEYEGGSPPPFFAAILPKLENLTIRQCTRVPQGLQLPAVLTIEAEYGFSPQSETAWAVIQRLAQTLVGLRISDCDSDEKHPMLLERLDLSSFPKLETLAHSYVCSYNSEKFQTWGEMASLLNVRRPSPNLRHMDFFIFLDGEDQFHDDFLSRVLKHYPWEVLDKALASGYFPSIKEVYIYLVITFSKLDAVGVLDATVHLGDTSKALRSNIMNSFSQSKTLPIRIKVGVDIEIS